MQYYAVNLKQLKEERMRFEYLDFDTGMPTKDCEYRLADQTSCDWLLKLEGDKFKNVDYSMKQNIVSYFHVVANNGVDKNPAKKCRKFFSAYNRLRAFTMNR